jgi:clan AA aspartic protease (TIGR02281 family)
VRIPFDKRGNDIIVQTQVNGRPVPFILDTGAGSVVVGQNHLREWGIGTSQDKNSFDIGGVGDGKAKGWTQRLDLKLGPIYQKNFPVTVMDNMPTEPLLGQTFLHAFNVSVDDSNRTVMLAKKGGSAAGDMSRKSYNTVEVPFTRGPGGHMMVQVEVNNKPFVMMFDTGCERTSFSAADWKKLGFEIPGNAQQGISKGVLGETQTYYFNTDSIKLKGVPRSVEQQNTPVSVAEGSPACLLGMSFYGKYKYTIDSVRSVILFEGVDR